MSKCQSWQRITKELPEAQLWCCRQKEALWTWSTAMFQCSLSYRTRRRRKYEIASVKSMLTHTPAPCLYTAHMWKVGGMCGYSVSWDAFKEELNLIHCNEARIWPETANPPEAPEPPGSLYVRRFLVIWLVANLSALTAQCCICWSININKITVLYFGVFTMATESSWLWGRWHSMCLRWWAM